ncbi:MAG: PDZ domain-containing protein [Planctomycetes bacterium]|nr:PDZ domain-containing protein [Planctomycetota bacterium]
MNSNEDIYMRYGGRDDSGMDHLNNVKSLVLALKKGREIHKQDVASSWKAETRAMAFFPRDYQSIRNKTINKKECVHCHQIGSAKTELAQKQGKLDKKVDPWVYPDIRNFGVELDHNKLLDVKKTNGDAKKAGLKKGDKIAKLAGHTVYTYADLQQRLHEMAFDSKELKLTVMRKKEEVEIVIPLDDNWRVTGINRRGSTHAIEPFPGFWSQELASSEKRKMGFKPEKMVARVGKFWVPNNPQPAFKAGLRKDDIIVAVNGVDECAYTNHPGVYIRLNFKAGDQIELTYIRGGKKLKLKYKCKARPW